MNMATIPPKIDECIGNNIDSTLASEGVVGRYRCVGLGRGSNIGGNKDCRPTADSRQHNTVRDHRSFIRVLYRIMILGSRANLPNVVNSTKYRAPYRLLTANTNSPVHPQLPSSSDFPPWSFSPKEYFRFEIIHQSKRSLARVGRITTPHGVIDTPGFAAVGTNAALKAIDFPSADATGQQLIFANTYHLLLHPGSTIIRDAGGIHKFTKRDRPFITDSGGFQVFSLKYGGVTESLESMGELKRAATSGSRNRKKTYWRSDVMGKVKVTEDHVEFKSYRDGSTFILSPESSIQAQKDIGADVSSSYADRDVSLFIITHALLLLVGLYKPCRSSFH